MSRSAPTPDTATSRTFAAASSSAEASVGSARRSAAAISSGATTRGPGSAPPVSSSRVRAATASSPPARTRATISSTRATTAGGIARAWRSARAAADGSVSSAARSTRTEPLLDIVDGGRLELVGHRIGDQPRGAAGDLLAHHESVLLQRRARRREVDDRLDQAGERSQLDRALDLDDLGLPAGLLEPARGDPGVLRGHSNHAEAPQGLRGRVVARASGQHHPAAAVAEVEELVDVALALLH